MSTYFNVTLTGDQEVPPNAVSASGVFGIGTVRWNPALQTATYQIVIAGEDFSAAARTGVATPTASDDVTSMHVHNAPRDASGGVVFGQIGPASDADDLLITQNPNGSWTIRGVWETTDPAPVNISAFADLLTAAQPGADVPLYFNSHTGPFPNGEIRGQWVAVADANAYFLI